jgi:putative FmdB family regulatory protein
MPTYDYRCKACGHTFELYQTMSEGEKRKCPECAKSSLERLIGAGAGLIFKGSGYYLTDYRSKSYEEGAKAERDAAKPKDTSDAKPKTVDKSAGKPKTEGEPTAKKSESDSAAKPGPSAPEGGRESAKKSSDDGPRKSAPRRNKK